MRLISIFFIGTTADQPVPSTLLSLSSG